MMISSTENRPAAGSTFRSASQNACKLCAPLGASLALAGVEGAVAFLHGSQGCATYIRRYMISHFKEPIDIASSNFGESDAIFGGKANMLKGLRNVNQQYHPQLIGVATTCLAETIGDDVGAHLRELKKADDAADLPTVIHVSTPSYSGTHAEGFNATLRALVEQLVEEASGDDDGGDLRPAVNVISGMLSPADLRHLKEIVSEFGLRPALLPDYSDTLDGPAWETYHLIPAGGTPLEDIRCMSRARATIELAATPAASKSAGALLETRFGVPCRRTGLPIGVLATDALCDALAEISGRSLPEKYRAERGRLIDSLVDSHKHLFGRRAVVYGEEDLVLGVASLLAEIGVVPAVCASGGASGRLAAMLATMAPDLKGEMQVVDGADFAEIEAAAEKCSPDVIIGNSKGFKMAQRLGVPLVRIGFPIHDRIGGPRLLHVGYRGAQALLDRIANALIEAKQAASPVGYTYM